MQHLPLTSVRPAKQVLPDTSSSSPLFTTIFHEKWWLDAVCPGWEEVSVAQDGKLVARMPFMVKRFMGVVGLCMPPLTHTLGPQLSMVDGKMMNDRGLLNELWGKLPPHHYFFHTCDPIMDHGLAAYALGYETRLGYTQRIPAGTDKEAFLKGMRRATRRLVRMGERTLEVDRDLAIDEFCAFYAKSVRENHGVWWSKARQRHEAKLRTRLYEACVARRAACLLGARDDKGELHAAIMPVWGHGTMYYLQTARRREAAPGAVHLLVFEALKLAHELGLTFDFDGFLRPDAVNFLTGFGGEVHKRLILSRQGPLIYLARALTGRLTL